MRVLHIGLACAHGGAESFLATLVREQHKMGMEAHVFFTTDLGASSQYEGVCKVMFADKELLAGALLRNNYDIVHISNHAVHWAMRSIKLTRYDGPIVVTYHVEGRYESGIDADSVVAVSHALADTIQPQCSKPVRVVWNGVNTEVFCSSEADKSEKPILAWVGRSTDARKDVAGLVAIAMSPIAAQFQVVLVDGSPPGEECQPYWLSKDAVIEVRKPWLEMPAFYRRVAASGGFLLSTSRVEALGLNILEAQACGCPAIGPKAGGIPEAIEHKSTGYVYEPSGGVAAVTEAIEWLYSGDNYAQASRRGIERVSKEFSAERMCREYAVVYEEASNLHKRRASRRLYQIMLRPAIPLARSVVLAYQRSRR